MFEREKRSYTLWDALREGPLKILVIGGGNWASVISRIAATNAKRSYVFDDTVHMWIHEEVWEGKNLTEIINTEHVNPKYLPDYSLPENLVATPHLIPRARKADLLIFVLPHQFVEDVCKQLEGQIKPTAQGVSLLKGLKVENDIPVLYTSIIEKYLNIPCSVMSGANVATEIARENFSETTLGYHPDNRENAAIWQQLFDMPYFKVNGVPDISGIELSGALKNIIALSVGFCDALNYGTNTKASLIRLGVEEIKLFANLFFEGIKEETFFDSAGFADVITTCFGGEVFIERKLHLLPCCCSGRNVRCAAEFGRRRGKSSWEEIEAELLKGQKLQGQLTAKEVYTTIKRFQLEDFFPLFTVTYKISFEGAPLESMLSTFTTEDLRHIKSLNECNSCRLPESFHRVKKFLSNLI